MGFLDTIGGLFGGAGGQAVGEALDRKSKENRESTQIATPASPAPTTSVSTPVTTAQSKSYSNIGTDLNRTLEDMNKKIQFSTPQIDQNKGFGGISIGQGPTLQPQRMEQIKQSISTGKTTVQQDLAPKGPTMFDIGKSKPQIEESIITGQTMEDIGGTQRNVKKETEALMGATYDITSGLANEENIETLYPEFKGKKEALLGLSYDLEGGVGLDKLKELYPEIAPQAIDSLYNTFQQDIKKPIQEENKKEESMLSKIGKGIIATTAGMGTAYGVGEALKRTGKFTYGLSLPKTAKEAEDEYSYFKKLYKNEVLIENETKALRERLNKGEITKDEYSKMIKGVKDKYKVSKPQTSVDVLYERGIAGTQGMIGKQSGKEAVEIFERKINPMLDVSKSKLDVKSLIDSFDSQIEELAGGDPDKRQEYKEALEELKKSFSGDEYKNMSLKEAQTLKSSLQKRGPAKFYKGKEISNSYDQLKMMLGSKIKDRLHSSIQGEFGVDSAKLYRDYSKLDEIGKKLYKEAVTSGGKKGGAGGFISNVYETLTTPLTTTAGWSMKKTGEGLQYVPKIVYKGLKEGAGIVKNVLKKVVRGGTVFSMFEDGTIIPGSPTQIAKSTMDMNEEYKKNPDLFYTGKNQQGIEIIFRKEDVENSLTGKNKNKFTDSDGNTFIVKGKTLRPIY